MKSAKIVIVAIVVVAILGVGGYMLLHKSNNSSNTSTTSGGSSKSTSTTVPAVNNSVLATKTTASVGQYLADLSGKPLYTYGADTSGVSNCSGACIATWPPYAPTSSTVLPAGVGTLKRSDGTMQYTYNGMPLYYFVGDHGSSTPTGDGIAHFSLARPAKSTSSQSSTSSNTSSSASAASSSDGSSNW